MQQVKSAVQIVGVTADPHGACGISSCVAAAHIVADVLHPKVGNQVLDQSGGAVAPVAVVAALASFRVRYNRGQCAATIHHHNSGGWSRHNLLFVEFSNL